MYNKCLSLITTKAPLISQGLSDLPPFENQNILNVYIFMASQFFVYIYIYILINFKTANFVTYEVTFAFI